MLAANAVVFGETPPQTVLMILQTGGFLRPGPKGS